jgi:hypothetical protein
MYIKTLSRHPRPGYRFIIDAIDNMERRCILMRQSAIDMENETATKEYLNQSEAYFSAMASPHSAPPILVKTHSTSRLGLLQSVLATALYPSPP